MDLWEWDTHTSPEGKWEFDGTPFCSEGWRDRVLMELLYSCGFRHLLKILPEESREEPFKLIADRKIKL
jgi:beta-galactosidase GanA